MARTSITIVLELDGAMDSPSGSARLPDGTPREFHGWLGLTEAIDLLMRAPVAAMPINRSNERKGERT